MESSLHDIVQGLMMARIHAESMAERWPHHAGTLITFKEEVQKLRSKLVSQLAREGLYGREPYEFEADTPPNDKPLPTSAPNVTVERSLLRFYYRCRLSFPRVSSE